VAVPVGSRLLQLARERTVGFVVRVKKFVRLGLDKLPKRVYNKEKRERGTRI
jgi:hypothetical protein